MPINEDDEPKIINAFPPGGGHRKKPPFAHGGGGGRGGGGGVEFEMPQLGGGWKFIVMGVLALYVVMNSYYIVGPDEVGLVLRLGKYNGAPTTPGFHFKLPFGVDQVYKPRMLHTFKEEFGFRTLRADQRTQYDQQEYDGESLHVTGNLDIVDTEWVIHYRITDPFLYQFHTKNLTETIRYASEVAMREVVGDHSFDEVIRNRDVIESKTAQALNTMMEEWKTGVHIHTLKMQNVDPPKPVAPAFNEVNEARQEAERLVNEGKADFNRAIPAAMGEAQRVIQEAEGYRKERTNVAQGEAERFKAILKEYRLAKDVTRQRLHLETLQTVLARTKNKVIVADDSGNTIKWVELRKPRSGGGN